MHLQSYLFIRDFSRLFTMNTHRYFLDFACSRLLIELSLAIIDNVAKPSPENVKTCIFNTKYLCVQITKIKQKNADAIPSSP